VGVGRAVRGRGIRRLVEDQSPFRTPAQLRGRGHETTSAGPDLVGFLQPPERTRQASDLYRWVVSRFTSARTVCGFAAPRPRATVAESARPPCGHPWVPLGGTQPH
jgi:hypothetical protein